MLLSEKQRLKRTFVLCLKMINMKGGGALQVRSAVVFFLRTQDTCGTLAVCNQILIADSWYEGQDILFVTAAQRQRHREVTPSQINIL